MRKGLARSGLLERIGSDRFFASVDEAVLAMQGRGPIPTETTTPKGKGELQSVPMPELQAELGSSPDGLTQAEAQKGLTQYGPNEIEEK